MYKKKKKKEKKKWMNLREGESYNMPNKIIFIKNKNKNV